MTENQMVSVLNGIAIVLLAIAVIHLLCGGIWDDWYGIGCKYEYSGCEDWDHYRNVGGIFMSGVTSTLYLAMAGVSVYYSRLVLEILVAIRDK